MSNNTVIEERHWCVLTRLLIVLIPFVAGLYSELFFESIGYFTPDLLNGCISVKSIICVLAFSSLWGISLYLLVFRCEHVLAFICEHRYFIFLTLFLAIVVLDINFSSIGIWASSINGGNGSGLLFGQPRVIRTDEYNVSTLWSFSQEFNGYSPLSSILGGGNTDTRFVYNSPSWSLITLFRPSLWGFLLFGSSRGLSWFWAFKYVFLFLSAYDCVSVFCQNKKIALAFSTLISLSPLLMWWDGWDGLIFGQYLVVFFLKWLNSGSLVKSSICSVIIAWLCGCYLFVLYPAWMVPFFYIFALMGLTQLYIYSKKGGNFNLLKISILFVAICLLVASVISIFISSSDSVKAMTSTVYPGARFSTGGGGFSEIVRYGYPLFFAIQQPSFSNACALSTIFCLFPLGTIFGTISFFKFKNRSIAPFLILQLFVFIFICVGVPPFVSKITLFSNVPTSRAVFPFGYIELFLFCYSIDWRISENSSPESRNKLNVLACLAGAGCFSILITILNVVFGQGDFRLLFVVILICVLFCISICSFSIQCGLQMSVNAMLYVVLCTMLVSGLAVHPVQRGISPVNGSSLSVYVRSVVNKDKDGLWAVEENPSLGNYIAANGAHCLTTTEGYPNLSLWHSLDPTGKYENCYNRYAHVSMSLGGSSVTFKLEYEDHFRVTMPFDCLNDLGVKYLLSSKDYSLTPDSDRWFSSVHCCNGYYIYTVK